MTEPNLDRFSRPLWSEKPEQPELPPTCYVCGNHINPRFLETWNGEEVCTRCQLELNEEFERFDGVVWESPERQERAPVDEMASYKEREVERRIERQ